MSELTLTLSGNTLPADITKELIDYADLDMNVPPSYLITLLNYESYWGSSNVGRENNNWAGMTFPRGESSPLIRPSGVTVTRGSARPSNEGGNYIRYQTVPDFIKDWTYLLRRGGIYKVADSSTFAQAVKGMFRVGGATYDYATMNVSTSQERYTLYLANMQARRNSINQANNQMMDRVDAGEFSGSDSPDPPDPTDPPKPPIESSIEFDRKKFMVAFKEFLNEEMFQLSDQFIGNHYFKLTKVFNKQFHLQATPVFYQEMEDLIRDHSKITFPNIPDPEPDPYPDPDPDLPANVPFYPVEKASYIYESSPYGWRDDPFGGSGRYFHAGLDIASGGRNVPIYAMTNAEVIVSQWSDTGGWMVYFKHSNDPYYSRYLHLQSRPLVSVGDTVVKGQQVGYMGTTGTSTGIHLHVELAYSNSGWSTESGTFDPKLYLDGTMS